MKNNCKELKLQTPSPFLILYENRVKEHSSSDEVGLKKFNSVDPLSDLQKEI